MFKDQIVRFGIMVIVLVLVNVVESKWSGMMWILCVLFADSSNTTQVTINSQSLTLLMYLFCVLFLMPILVIFELLGPILVIFELLGFCDMPPF